MELLALAKNSRQSISLATTEKKNEALCLMADYLIENTDAILQANELDMSASKGILSEVMMDRLALSVQRIEDMAKGIREVALLPDPVGAVMRTVSRPNGLVIEKTSVAMGVIAIIYESRPNVTSDAASLALKAGSACVLRSGKEAHKSSEAIVCALRKGLKAAGLDENCIVLIEDTTRQSANEIMAAAGIVDLLIPRGGAGLIRSCVDNSAVPVLETGTGICHIYVDKDADFDMALDIIENAKASRPSVCNSAEVCLVNKEIANDFLPLLHERLVTKRENPIELRLCEASQKIIEGTAAGEKDFDTEFLDYILAVKVVSDVRDAVAHIALHSTGHSDVIVTANGETAQIFLSRVDSAAVYHNASSRFTDGGQFGLGCEMGISTQKLHARGPLGLEELCTYKYIIRGNGQIR